MHRIGLDRPREGGGGKVRAYNQNIIVVNHVVDLIFQSISSCLKQLSDWLIEQ